eukprot:2050310-Pyramimonas_sp.AAC.1
MQRGGEAEARRAQEASSDEGVNEKGSQDRHQEARPPREARREEEASGSQEAVRRASPQEAVCRCAGQGAADRSDSEEGAVQTQRQGSPPHAPQPRL